MCAKVLPKEVRMKICGDYHLHTTASDGRCSILAHAKRADEAGLDEIAITDHGFASTFFHVTRKKFDEQERQISALDCKVRVLHGVEANVLNKRGDIDIPRDVIRRCDVLCAGFHRYIGSKGERRGGADYTWLLKNGFGSKKTRQKLIDDNTDAFVAMLKKFPVDTVAHLNHRALVDVARVAEVAKETGAFVELNEKHIDALDEWADALVRSGVNFIVGTDAHSAKKTGKTDKIQEFVKRHGIDPDRVFGLGDNKPKFKDKKEWCENGNEF